MRLLYIITAITLIITSCNQSRVNANSRVLKDTLKEAKVQSNMSSDDSDEKELTSIINEFKAQYTKHYDFDTVFVRNTDTFKVVFNYRCLFDSGLVIPTKYVGIYGFKTFTAHNFSANLSLYKNNNKVFDNKITKSIFSDLIDESLKKYGDMLYPDVAIMDSLVKVHFSISVPLTDVGISVNYVTGINGGSYTIDGE